MKRFSFPVFALALCLFSASAFAQATRTWVSGVGDDVNPCSRTAPCKTWAGAISKTAVGGEIDALDSGGFGAVTINKSITLNGSGFLASTLATGASNGIIVNAAGINVILRNMEISGAYSGLNGVRILNANSVRFDNVHIYGFTNRGIDIQSTSPVKVTIDNSMIRNNTAIGVAAASGVAMLDIFHSFIEGNGSHGVWSNSGTATISQSVLQQNGLAGAVLTGSGKLTITDSTLSANNKGVEAGTGTSMTGIVTISNNTITNNTASGVSLEGGTVQSTGDNTIRGNLPDVNGGSLTPVTKQ